MNRDWTDIKWIFEPDGSLLDIYVQDVSLKEWEILIDHLNENFSLIYAGTSKIDKDYVLGYLGRLVWPREGRSVTINSGHIKINCHFFLPDQIEFDLNPEHIQSMRDFELVENFMLSISSALQEQVILTSENAPDKPLFKVDVKNGINKILTSKEADKIFRNMSLMANRFSLLKVLFMRRFFPQRYAEQLLASADEEYRSSRKEDNVW